MNIRSTKINFFVFAILLLAGFYFISSAQENSTSDKNVFLDSDQDGLSDEEEKTYGTDLGNRDTDGDGYTDGAEVKSGYDPLKHSPGDKLVLPPAEPAAETTKTSGGEKNLTQEVSAEVANLITEKAGENQEVALEDLDSIIENATSDILTFEDLPAVNMDEIKIKKQKFSKLSKSERAAKEKKDALEYLTAISYIFVNNSPQNIKRFSDIEMFSESLLGEVDKFALNPNSDISYFEDLAYKGESALEQIKEIEVPENMLDMHIDGMKLAKYSISLRSDAKPDPEDPVGTIAKLSKVQSLINLSLQYMNNINTELSKLGIAEIPLDL